MKKLLAIDGNSIINRAYYGIRPLTNKNGLYTHAVYGMINIITSQMQQYSPDACVAAFDLKAPTFRHKMFDGYKATRKGMPEELAEQLPYAKRVLDAMGITVSSVEGYEADDILGTLSAMSGDDLHVYILTGDRDSLQLIGDNVSVLLVSTGETKEFDRDAFYEKYGIEPSEYVDAKALMGDSSDNIPGVPGIGEKTAMKLIAEYKNIENLYEHIDAAPVGNSSKEKLIAGKESAEMSKVLATICKTVPLGYGMTELSQKAEDRKELYDLFTELEFSAFIKRFGLEEDAQKVECVKFSKVDKLPDSKGDVYSLYRDDMIYLYDGENGFALSPDVDISQFLCDNRFIVHDSKAEFYADPGINAEFDVSVAAYLVNSGDGDYSPEKLALRYLGQGQTDMREEDADSIVSRGSRVCEQLFKLKDILSAKIEDEGVHSLYYDVELPLCRVLYEMEKRGFRIDTKGLAEFGKKLDQRLEAIKDRIYMQCGEEFNINSPKQLGHILFEVLKLPSGKKTKTGYSTNAEVLEKLRAVSPVIDDILEYRAVTKLIGTYVDGMLGVCDENGIIHTSFNQTVTATGRLSSKEPNLQNIPIRTELGRELRKFFIPRSEDYVLVDADYSQIELRLLAAISGDENMLEAFRNGTDIHTMTASQVFRTPVDFVTPEMRKRAKAVNFGIVYGIGAFSLSQDIHVSVKAAEKYISDYLAAYPGVSAYLDGIKAEAKKKGYVQTLLGRRRYIPELSSAKKPEQAFGERVAMNSPIQGTAADIIKIAMVNTEKALKESGYDAHLILQVHDELIIEARRQDTDAIRELLRSKMEDAVNLPVKLSVEVTDGDTWYECK
ncbi:MAG: DNA polymerase I [Clostridia bacterium]|nr:DNA polymerase I [Clostridia bacterium]